MSTQIDNVQRNLTTHFATPMLTTYNLNRVPLDSAYHYEKNVKEIHGQPFLDVDIDTLSADSDSDWSEGSDSEQSSFQLRPSQSTLQRILPWLPIWGNRGFDDIDNYFSSLDRNILKDSDALAREFIRISDLRDRLWVEIEIMTSMGDAAKDYWPEHRTQLNKAKRQKDQLDIIATYLEESASCSVDFDTLCHNRIFLFPLVHPLWQVQTSLRPAKAWVPGVRRPIKQRNLAQVCEDSSYFDVEMKSSASRYIELDYQAMDFKRIFGNCPSAFLFQLA